MSSNKKGSKFRSENIASNTGPSAMEELYSSTPCVQFLLEAVPIWEPIHLKFLCSNLLLTDITGYTQDELLVPGFDFLKLVISEDYHEPMLKWLTDLEGCCIHSPYQLIFTLHTPNGPSGFVIADCKLLPPDYPRKAMRYNIAGLMTDKKILPFKSFEESYKRTARREFQDIYNSLTELDFKVLELLAQGEPSKNIYRVINMGQYTFDRYRTYMEKKFKVKNCTEMIAKAIRMGII